MVSCVSINYRVVSFLSLSFPRALSLSRQTHRPGTCARGTAVQNESRHAFSPHLVPALAFVELLFEDGTLPTVREVYILHFASLRHSTSLTDESECPPISPQHRRSQQYPYRQ
jgi:hypothetical protein